jgi:transcriptional regulator with XRE-family HTH domain
MTVTTVLAGPAVEIRELRQARGLSQERVAQLAGCSTSMVRQLERGYVPVGSAVLPRVIRALNEEERPAGNGTPSESAGAGTADHGSG